MSDNTMTPDALLEELKNLNKDLKKELTNVATPVAIVTTTPVISAPPPFQLTEDNLSDFILKSSQDLVKIGIETVDSLKSIIATTADAKSMSGFADICKATSSALDTLNAINIEKRKNANAKELKKLDIESRKLITDSKKAPTQNNFIITGREQIMKMLEEAENTQPTAKIIDIPSE